MDAESLKALLARPLVLLLLMMAGSLGSAWKQMVAARKAGSTASVGDYFLANWPETVVALGQNFAIFGGLLMTDSLNWASALGAGYVANSTADVWTTKGRAVAIAPPPAP